jgi:histone H3/H4
MPRERIVVESKVRELLPEGIRLASDALDGLDQAVRELINKAAQRCKANGRKTIIKEDF